MTQKAKTQKVETKEVEVIVQGKVKSKIDGKVVILPKDSVLKVELIDGKLPSSLVNKVVFKK